MGENQTEPLAKTRARRSNAGARMHEIIFAAEDNEILAQNLGLLKADDDSSDDEEYVPKELEVGDGDRDNDANNDDDDDSNSADSTGDSSDEEDEDEEEEDEDEEDEEEQVNLDTLNNDGCNLSARIKGEPISEVENEYMAHGKLNAQIQPGSPKKEAYESCRKICSVCLGDQSDEDDEIIVCDSCGVSVHESCYGVSGEEEENQKDETTSVHSNISSESTEAWFCEPCKRSVRNPLCELCPNTGGIFKQTDTGRWIHMVCALYTRGITFEDIGNLSEVSLFELNYALYGSKACTICEDRRLARSGVCIGCDAGLCKTFFHATCAQKEGLLFESHSDEVDPYFAHCRQHADKSVIRKKKRLCTALHARLKKIEPLQACSDRIKKKLAAITQEPDPHLTKWTPDNIPPIPPKASRMLMTSSSLITRLTKKTELMGLDPNSAFMDVQDEMEMARQKWHIPPAFNLEFVAYCRDRTTRMTNMKKQNTQLMSQNITLKTEEANLREKFNSIKEAVSKLKLENDSLIKEARAIQKTVAATTGKQFNLPLQLEQLIARCSNAKDKNLVKASKVASKTSSTYGCGKCETVKDQHLLALCDTCHSYFHIYCLDPPLSRVPKKTKFGGWQCSDCSEKDEEEQEEAIEEQNILAVKEADGPRRLRERIKYPEKYCHESMMMVDFWSLQRKRPKKSSKMGSKSKKPKVEAEGL